MSSNLYITDEPLESATSLVRAADDVRSERRDREVSLLIDKVWVKTPYLSELRTGIINKEKKIINGVGGLGVKCHWMDNSTHFF